MGASNSVLDHASVVVGKVESGTTATAVVETTPAKRKYDSTLARIAGNIAPALVGKGLPHDVVVTEAVKIARGIIAELEQ